MSLHRFAIMLAITTLLLLGLVYGATIAQAAPVSQSQFRTLAKKVKRQEVQIHKLKRQQTELVQVNKGIMWQLGNLSDHFADWAARFNGYVTCPPDLR